MKRKVIGILLLVIVLGICALIPRKMGKLVLVNDGIIMCNDDWKECIALAGNNAQELALQKQRENEKLEQYLEQQINALTLEQKLAQMMILTNEKDITESVLKRYQPGGIIFFRNDFDGKTKAEVSARVDTLQSYMQISLFVGVDEEGGKVTRLSGLLDDGIPVFKSARELGEQGQEAIRQDTQTKMTLLKEMGINLNFAPVADVVKNKSSYMYTRSASGNPEQVADYVETVVSVMQEENIGSCMKHFPGYGENVNTHNSLAIDERAVSEYEENDFVPFERGIQSGADMVMVGHIVVKQLDDTLPASLSPKVHQILREDLVFNGIIIADDLNMKALLNTMTIEEATVQAFAAGNDMIFSADFQASMQGAKNAVKEGTLTEEQIEQSLKRIFKMKLKYGLLKQ